jgi:hypothetical protein
MKNNFLQVLLSRTFSMISTSEISDAALYLQMHCTLTHAGRWLDYQAQSAVLTDLNHLVTVLKWIPYESLITDALPARRQSWHGASTTLIQPVLR